MWIISLRESAMCESLELPSLPPFLVGRGPEWTLRYLVSRTHSHVSNSPWYQSLKRSSVSCYRVWNQLKDWCHFSNYRSDKWHTELSVLCMNRVMSHWDSYYLSGEKRCLRYAFLFQNVEFITLMPTSQQIPNRIFMHLCVCINIFSTKI